MFVVYEVRFWNETPKGNTYLRSNPLWQRLEEFKTLEYANDFLQEKMDEARDKGLDVSYTIVMEN